MQHDPTYLDVVAEVCEFLRTQRAACEAAGIAAIGHRSRSWSRVRQGLGAQPGLAPGAPADRGARLPAAGGCVAQELHRPHSGAADGGADGGRPRSGGAGREHGSADHPQPRCPTHARCDTNGGCRVEGRRGQTGSGNVTIRYFGTDGVRGRVGQPPMTVDFALRLASAAARVLAPAGGRVLIGKDTRLSGYLFESALEAGFVAAGVDVMLIGPLPTPGIAYMTQRLACSFGVVISASHNPYEDNGIKFFDSMGSKLSDEIENLIEASIEGPVVTQESQHLGRAVRIDRSRTQYQEFCASTDSRRDEPQGLQDRHRLREWRRLQSSAARARRSRRGNRADRLLAERAQHQRRLRLDRARAPAAHRAGGARARGACARRRWRPGGDGRRTRALRGRRSAALHPRHGPVQEPGNCAGR